MNHEFPQGTEYLSGSQQFVLNLLIPKGLSRVWSKLFVVRLGHNRSQVQASAATADFAGFCVDNRKKLFATVFMALVLVSAHPLAATLCLLPVLALELELGLGQA